MSLLGSMEQLRQDRALLEQLIENNGLGADFQPVRALATNELVGWKAIARGPAGSNVESPAGLLHSAKATGYVERLDWMFRCNAFEQALAAGVRVDLYVTPEVETYGSMCPPRLGSVFSRAKRELSVVVDVSERAFADPRALRRGVDEFRSYGWKIAVDDCADVPDALRILDEVKPDAVRVDLGKPGRTAGFSQDARVTGVLEWASEHHAVLLADGIDTELRRGEAKALGCKAGRGRLFGMPGILH